MRAAALLLAAAAAAAAPSARRLALLDHDLRAGAWNERIHAAQELGELGVDGLPGLRVAAEDADWQVRLTAVHLMGRVGAPAAADLARVLRREPCRNVRLTALHWLGAMGPAVTPVLKEALSDESGMMRLMSRYWLRKDGAAGAQDELGEAQAAADEDLRVCAASPEPGRAPWSSAPAAAAAAAAAEPPPLVEDLHTPEPPGPEPKRGAAAAESRSIPLARERLRELDALLAPETAAPEILPPGPAVAARAAPTPEPETTAAVEPRREPSAGVAAPLGHPAPETLPPGPAVEPRPEPGLAPAAAASVEPRREPSAALAAGAARPAPESLPPGPPGLARAGLAPAAPTLEADVGTGKADTDPVPALLALLGSSDPRARARAADELGKFGTASASAVPALSRALADRDARVRASAALALGNVGPASDPAVPALVAALKRGPEEVSWSAALALGRVGTPRAREAFARYARQTSAELLDRQDASGPGSAR